MVLNESREMYLEVMLKLERKNGGQIRVIDIAKELNVTKPSVSRAVVILENLGYIDHTPYGEIKLLDKGREEAEELMRKHNLLTSFFIHTLEIDPKTAEQDACRIEHVINEKTIQAIEVYLANAMN